MRLRRSRNCHFRRGPTTTSTPLTFLVSFSAGPNNTLAHGGRHAQQNMWAKTQAARFACALGHTKRTRREAWHLAASCKQANGVCYLQARRAALVCSHETDASAPRPPPAIASPHTRSVSHQREQHQHLLGEDTRKTGSATLAKRPCCSGVMLCH